MRIDIIVPTYNRKKDIQKFIIEIQRQTYKDYHVYIIDDCGNQDLSALINNPKKCTLVRLTENRGQAFARNHAVSISDGDIIVFMDDDAYFIDSDALDKVALYFRNENAGGLMFNIKEPKRQWLNQRKGLKQNQEVAGFIACGCAFLRESFINSGGFPEHFHSYGEETFMTMNLIQKKEKILFAKDIPVFHNYNPGERAKKWQKRFKRNSVRNDLLIVIKKFPLLLTPIYFTGKLLSHIFYTLSEESNKFMNLKAIFVGAYKAVLEGSIVKRDPLNYQQFKYWKNYRL